MSEPDVRSSDPATLAMIDLAGQAGIATAWDRLAGPARTLLRSLGDIG